MGFKLKRDEYCIIWRDISFSKNPIYNNQSDNLTDLMIKIIQKVKFNIYACSTSEEALKLIDREKYNKIILISNIGADLGGYAFVNNARKIIRNDIIVLFSDFDIEHLSWVKNLKNALFSNETK